MKKKKSKTSNGENGTSMRVFSSPFSIPGKKKNKNEEEALV